jgi:hypothetical protein
MSEAFEHTANSRGGAIRHAVKDRKNDLYETPPQATQALLRVENLPHDIWEPACGRGAISSVLEGAGHEVMSTDLVDYGYGVPGCDFLMEWESPRGIEAIVTNPPYKNADAFVRKGLELVPAVYMLLRWAYAEGVGRSDIIDNHLSRVWLGRERLPMMHRDGWDGTTQTNSAMPFAWFVFTREQTGGSFQVRRMSWRANQQEAAA